MGLKERADKKVKEGWIRATAMIEVLAVSKEAAKSALEKHVEKLGKEPGILLYKREFQGIKKVVGAMPKKATAYSNLVEIEFVADSFDRLVKIVMNYGPSSIEILEPKELKIDMGEAQGILNSLAEMLHRFAASGIGGIVVST